MLRLGLDIGGTKIEAIVMDRQGEVIFRKRTPTPKTSYPDFIDAIVRLISDAKRYYPEGFSIGAGLPGAISPDTGAIKNSNILTLNGKDLKSDLSYALGQEVFLANDADCFTLSEAMDGAASGAPIVFGVILGTGCGGGIVINHQLIVGPNAITGEWGHNPLPSYDKAQDGDCTPCYCGQPLCIENFISGTGFQARFNLNHQTHYTSPEIIALKEAGDPDAIAHYESFIDMLARSLASVMNLLDPHTIVIGGGMSNVNSIYPDVLNRVLNYLCSERCNTKIVAAKYGDSSGVRGAAWLPQTMRHA